MEEGGDNHKGPWYTGGFVEQGLGYSLGRKLPRGIVSVGTRYTPLYSLPHPYGDRSPHPGRRETLSICPRDKKESFQDVSRSPDRHLSQSRTENLYEDRREGWDSGSPPVPVASLPRPKVVLVHQPGLGSLSPDGYTPYPLPQFMKGCSDRPRDELLTPRSPRGRRVDGTGDRGPRQE